MSSTDFLFEILTTSNGNLVLHKDHIVGGPVIGFIQRYFLPSSDASSFYSAVQTLIPQTSEVKQYACIAQTSSRGNYIKAMEIDNSEYIERAQYMKYCTPLLTYSVRHNTETGIITFTYLNDNLGFTVPRISVTIMDVVGGKTLDAIDFKVAQEIGVLSGLGEDNEREEV